MISAVNYPFQVIEGKIGKKGLYLLVSCVALAILATAVANGIPSGAMQKVAHSLVNDSTSVTYCKILIPILLGVGIAGTAAIYLYQSSNKTSQIAKVSNFTTLKAPLSGKCVELLVKEGDKVEVGSIIAKMEAMKMEVTIRSTVSGTVKEVFIQEEEIINKGSKIINFFIIK